MHVLSVYEIILLCSNIPHIKLQNYLLLLVVALLLAFVLIVVVFFQLIQKDKLVRVILTLLLVRCYRYDLPGAEDTRLASSHGLLLHYSAAEDPARPVRAAGGAGGLAHPRILLIHQPTLQSLCGHLRTPPLSRTFSFSIYAIKVQLNSNIFFFMERL